MNTSIKRKRRAGLFLDRHAAIYYLMTMFKYHGFIFFNAAVRWTLFYLYLSIRIPTLGIFFERIRSIRAYGDTRCRLHRTLLHRLPGSRPFATYKDPNIRTRFHIQRVVSLPR